MTLSHAAYKNEAKMKHARTSWATIIRKVGSLYHLTYKETS